jgi:endonuclease/exonuclease/phosphatase family metal-dependent hydrolase
MERRRFLLENLSRCAKLGELRRTEFFARCSQEIEELLSQVRIVRCPEAAPRLKSFLRVAQWNVERGVRFPQILETLRSDETLKWADIILLNEADVGMSRSENRDVACELAESLGMHMIFGAAHLELTGGNPDSAGENQGSLQGNAVLSRYPVRETRIIALPTCFEPYESQEKRYGRRNCVWACLAVGNRAWWVGSTHLEVRNTPRCRALQMRRIMEALPGENHEPHLLGGDFNSNTFPRGTQWRTLAAAWRLAMNSPSKVQAELIRPQAGKEPLFQVAHAAGFGWKEFNSHEPTVCAPLERLEDARLLSRWVRRSIQKRLDRYHGYLNLKLDWFLARNARALTDKEMRDSDSGVFSAAPGCVAVIQKGPDRLSDHSPIYTDLRL